MAKIVILGAGLTGLSAAYHLEQQGYFDYLLFEKEPTVGGLCRSVTQDGFTFDYTGHLLHINDDYFKKFIATTVGFEHFTAIKRQAAIYSHATYTAYPYQVNLHGLPPDIIADCIEGFINRKAPGQENRSANPAHSPQPSLPAPSFQDWVLANFGQGLADNFFFPYQSKIFDFDLQELSSSWTGRFVPPTSLRDIILGALRPPPVEAAIGYNAQFFYPKAGGIQFWLQKMHAQLIQQVRTDHEVTAIDTERKLIQFRNGHVEPYEQLMSTLPLNSMLAMLKERSSTSLQKAAEKLVYTSVININLGINRPAISANHWVYFPEHKYPFYRIGFPHNLAASMAPAEHSSISIECSVLNSKHVDQTALVSAAKRAVMQLMQLSPADIVTEKVMTIKHAYVIFDRWRDQHIGAIHEQLATAHIYSVGRYGAWKYSSMQEGLLDGKAIAEQILQPMRATEFTAKERAASL